MIATDAFFAKSQAASVNFELDNRIVCPTGTTLNLITNECDPDVTQANLDAAQAQRDAILTTLFEFLRVFGVI